MSAATAGLAPAPRVDGPARRGALGRVTAVRADVTGRRAGWALASILLLTTAVALLAPVLAPHDPVQPVGMPYAPPGTGGFLLGTDAIGRDLLSRTLLGMRSSWLASLVIVAGGLVVGGTIGLVAGAAGGWFDTLLMRVTDLFLSLPSTLVAIAVVAALGPGLAHTFFALLLVWWPYYARIVRGEVRSLAARPHVEAARLAGCGRARIALRHLLPGVVPSAVVSAGLDIGNVVLVLASLSFLGLGQPAPAPELGADTARALAELLQHWWIPVVPGVAALLLSLAGNVGGDGVRALLAKR